MAPPASYAASLGLSSAPNRGGADLSTTTLTLRSRILLGLLGLGVLGTDLYIVHLGRHSWSAWRLVAPAAALALLTLLPTDQRPPLHLGMPPPGQRRLWLITGAAVVLFLVAFWTASRLHAPHDCHTTSQTSLYAGRHAFRTVRWWLFAIVGVLGEELIYRVGSLPHLIAAFGPRAAIAVNAAAFTVLHVFYYHQFLWLYPIGALLYAWVFTAGRSAPLVTAVHFGTNLTAALVSYVLWSVGCT